MCRLREAAAALRSALHRRLGQVARRAAVAAAALSYAIHFGTLAHPFLLADNRCAPPFPCLLVLIIFPKAMHDFHTEAYCRGSFWWRTNAATPGNVTLTMLWLCYPTQQSQQLWHRPSSKSTPQPPARSKARVHNHPVVGTLISLLAADYCAAAPAPRLVTRPLLKCTDPVPTHRLCTEIL